jgi:hypothetical protein
MKTYSANSIAEQFERDRGVVVRALRNAKPDATVAGRPQWKIATAAVALERHRAGGGTTTRVTIRANPPECDAFNQAFAELVALPTLPARRSAAIAMVPALNSMVTAVGAVGEDRDMAGARGDLLYQTSLAGFQGPCEWTNDDVWRHLNLDADADAECS